MKRAIFYKSKSIAESNTLITPCTYFKNIMVGSVKCRKCQHFSSQDKDKMNESSMILCNHP